LIDFNRWLTRIAAMLVSLAVLASVAQPGCAQTQPAATAAPAAVANVPPVVAVMDLQYILANAKATRGIRAALEKQAAAFQTEFAQQENAIRAQGQQLEQQRQTLSQQDFASKKAAFDQQVEVLRQKAATRNKQLQQMENGAMSQVEQALGEVTAEIAKARGLTMVLNKAAVVLNLPSYDITKEVLGKLDTKLSSVKLPAPH
jgi:outer membrane protein